MKLSDDKIAAIKTATWRLIDEVGGLEAAASVCRVSVPVLSEYQSRNKPDRIIPVDVVVALERVAGKAIVTEALARMAGLALTNPDASAAPRLDVTMAAIAGGAGQLTADYVAARADGVLDAAERAALVERAAAVHRATGEFVAGLSEGAALRVVA
jgi:hypothetical protein